MEKLRVTGDTGRDIGKWIFSSQAPTITEEQLNSALFVEVRVLVSMGSQSYDFESKFYLKLIGGSLGLSLMAWLASLVMRCFNVLLVALM